MLDIEEKKMIERIARMTEENNHLVRKLYRSMLWRRALGVVYWTILIGLSIGAFYFLQPYVEALREAVGVITGVNLRELVN
jgi:TRAP-type C4-dicarboxylate transport system permease small subunit